MDKIKTILAGIEGLEERIADEKGYFYDGQRRAYELVKNIIYQQFPELQESEDERIRKWISDILDESNWRKDWPYTKQQVINYLEKQKDIESKYAGMVVVSQEEWDEAIAYAFKLGKEEGEKQKEQKSDVKDPFDDEQFRRGYEAGKHDAMREQKPAEWSEEDEKMLKRVLETYTCYEADIRSKDVLSDNDIEVLHECAEEKIWLKGRFKSFRPQPKQEWSE